MVFCCGRHSYLIKTLDRVLTPVFVHIQLAAQGAASSTKAATSSLSLNDKLQTVSKEEEGLFKMLVEAKQEHLFQAWPEKGNAEASKHAFFKQVGPRFIWRRNCLVTHHNAHISCPQQLVPSLRPNQPATCGYAQVAELDKSYPGGVAAYIRKARSLLGAAVRQENPFEGMTPSVPEGETLTYATPEFVAAEERGLSEVGHAAFVIVAGGLGERLGYQGIKLALPVDTLTGKTYLEYYVTFIRALQARAAKATGKSDVRIPLVIMTSDDTDKQVSGPCHIYPPKTGSSTNHDHTSVWSCADGRRHWVVCGRRGSCLRRARTSAWRRTRSPSSSRTRYRARAFTGGPIHSSLQDMPRSLSSLLGCLSPWPEGIAGPI